MSKSSFQFLEILYILLILVLLYSVFPIGIEKNESLVRVVKLIGILGLIGVAILYLNKKKNEPKSFKIQQNESSDKRKPKIEAPINFTPPEPIEKKTEPQTTIFDSYRLNNFSKLSFEEKLAKNSNDFNWKSISEEKFNEQFKRFEKDFESLLNYLLQKVKSVLDAKTVCVFLLDLKEHALFLKAGLSESQNFHLGSLIPFGGNLPGTVVKREETLMENTIPENSPAINYYSENEITGSFLGVPLVLDEGIIGVLVADSELENKFSEKEKQLLETFSKIIEKLITNFEELKNTNRKFLFFSGLYEVSLDLSSQFKEQDVIFKFLEIVKKVFNYDRLAIAFSIPDSQEAEIAYLDYSNQDFKDEEIFSVKTTFNVNEGLNGYVLRKNEALVISDLRKNLKIEGDFIESGDDGTKEVNFHPRYTNSEETSCGYRSFLAVPFETIKKAGIITLESKKPSFFNMENKEILKKLTVTLGGALDRASYYSELKHLATTDGLTRIPNRRAFDEKLTLEIQRSERYNLKMQLLMIDIDHFKIFNDNYGHLVGDEVLRQVAQSLAKMIRSIDGIGRYGGEEFSILLINTNTEQAIKKAEMIRSQIEKKAFSFEGSEYKLTISIGVAEFNKKTMQNAKDFIRVADKALYASKNAGRNRVTFYDFPPDLDDSTDSEPHA